MKCQICLEKNATIVFTKIVNNEKAVLHICSECAKKQGLTIEIVSSEPFDADPVELSHPEPEAHEIEADDPDLSCENCGLRYSDFKRTGFFGCDNCYNVFDKYIVNILKQIHGSSVHEGKVPVSVAGDHDLRKQLRTLRLKLKRCVESEEYERAAELRDTISSLEGKLVRHDV